MNAINTELNNKHDTTPANLDTCATQPLRVTASFEGTSVPELLMISLQTHICDTEYYQIEYILNDDLLHSKF